MKKNEIPKLVIIGNIAYDIINFSKVNINKEQLKNVGGACIFSSVPASLFGKVGIVGKIGNDFNISNIKKYNIDLSGIKEINESTTRFFTAWNTADGQDRSVEGSVSHNMEIGANDIPNHYLKANHFHLTTANPIKQLEIINYLRKKTNATISVDTIDEFAAMPECKKVFDSVDIAFIDKEYTELQDCKAKIKIIKLGKTGCLFLSEREKFYAYSNVTNNVVDKTGAGDCLNGVFLNLLVNGMDYETSLQTAVNVATESVKQNGIIGLEHNSTINKIVSNISQKSP